MLLKGTTFAGNVLRSSGATLTNLKQKGDNTMKKSLTLALALVALATVAGLTFGRSAATAPPPPQLVEYRAGTAAWPINSAGIHITFSSPMPPATNTNYALAVKETNTAGYSPTSVCTYFNPLHKTASGFDVQHKRCLDGAPMPLDTGVSLDYIAIEKK